MPVMASVQSWGRLGAPLHLVETPSDIAAVQRMVTQRPDWLPHGLGRSYGDVAQNAGGRLIDSQGLDRFVAFDRDTGVIAAEAGVTLEDIIRVALPQGWFLPTTPGTRYVTLGGAIANDVHGKNHHIAGAFGCWVKWLELARSDGSLMRCSLEENAEFFRATIGGLGLTGFITRAALQLVPVKSAWLESEDIAFYTLDEFFDIARQSDAAGWEHTVAWMDCTGRSAGRGIFTRARWSADGELDLRLDRQGPGVPFDAPAALLNPLSVKLFNTFYFGARRRRPGQRRVHYIPAFYPLDGVRDWNRVYGRRGFYQYQCVVPAAAPRAAMAALLQEIADSGMASFLVVIKAFGARSSPGLLSFPMAGTNLALDILNRGNATAELFERMDAIVGETGGRIYPAKDARMPGRLFRTGYPEWEKIEKLRDPRIQSDFWNRVTR